MRVDKRSDSQLDTGDDGARRRLPRPVVWLLWSIGALIASVVLGFLAGLARPRDPVSWTPERAKPEPPTTAETAETD